MKRVIESTNLPFAEMEKALNKFADQVPWKDLIPFILKRIEVLQPKDDPYTLKFWIREYRRKFDL